MHLDACLFSVQKSDTSQGVETSRAMIPVGTPSPLGQPLKIGVINNNFIFVFVFALATERNLLHGILQEKVRANGAACQQDFPAGPHEFILDCAGKHVDERI